MAYTIEDENGFLNLGPSINGLRELKAFLKKQDLTTFKTISEFLEQGYTHETKRLAKECKAMAKLVKSENENISFSFQELAKDASKARGIVILAM